MRLAHPESWFCQRFALTVPKMLVKSMLLSSVAEAFAKLTNEECVIRPPFNSKRPSSAYTSIALVPVGSTQLQQLVVTFHEPKSSSSFRRIERRLWMFLHGYRLVLDKIGNEIHTQVFFKDRRPDTLLLSELQSLEDYNVR